MPRTAIIFFAVTFVLATALFASIAAMSVRYLENQTESEISLAMKTAGLEWATVRPDGLQVHLTGLAPDEASHLRAVGLLYRFIKPDRAHDASRVLQSGLIEPPRFSLEVLRNVDEFSLIGLVPLNPGPRDILNSIRNLDTGAQITDMLESADHPQPEGWSEALNFGLDSLGMFPRSKISILPGKVTVTAVSDTSAQQKTLQQKLAFAKPEGVTLVMNISAPRPVIAPFRFSMAWEEDTIRLISCSADTEDSSRHILSSVADAGLNEKAQCEIGLGVPTTEWPHAIKTAVTAMSELGAGTLTFTDTEITLVAAETVEKDRFDTIVGRLENSLPELFSLHAILTPKQLERSKDVPVFTATLSPEGLVQMQGRVKSQLTKQAAEVFASSLFGPGKVFNQTRIDDRLPDGWPVRVLTSLEGLAELHHGSVTVGPETISINGVSAKENSQSEISRIFAVRLGGKANVEISVRVDPSLKPKDAPTSNTTCEKKIFAVLSQQQIVFAPSSTRIEPASQGVLDGIAEILRECPPAQFEIQGYTDSKGGAELNQRISQERAEAIVAALIDRKILPTRFSAIGFGEKNPIADNETEAGRALNRRIAFALKKEPDSDEQD